MRSHAWVERAHVVVPPSPGDRHPSHRMLVVPSARGVQALRRYGKQAVVHELGAPGDWPASLEWRFVEEVDAPRSDDEIGQSRPIVRDVQKEHGGKFSCTVRVPYEMRIFDGHFPAMPIVPGVMQLRWVVDLAAEHLGVPRLIKAIPSVKFRRLVQPGMELKLCVEWSPDRGEVRFGYTQAETCISVGRLLTGGRRV